jgi:hypothetical protein
MSNMAQVEGSGTGVAETAERGVRRNPYFTRGNGQTR